MRRPQTLLLISALFLAPSLAWAQASAPTSTSAPALPSGPLKVGASAYERLDPTKLTDALSQMGLTTLLPIYANELQATSPLDAKFVQAEILICQARRNKGDLPEYFKGMDAALVKLREIAAAAQKAADPYALLRSYRYRMQLADVMGNEAVEPLLERMIYVHASPEDRKLVTERTVESAKLFDTLTRNLKDKLIEVAGNSADMMAIGNDLGELEKSIVYKAGCAYLTRGMALDEAKDKMPCLRNAIAAMDRFVQDADGDTGSLKFDAMLHTGEACRELKEWQRATDMLKGAMDKGADPDTSLRANYELARLLIEKKDFEAAKTQLKTFLALGIKTFGEQRKAVPNMQYAFLLSYLYEQWAKEDKAKAAEYEAMGQKVLLDFVAAFPEAAAEFWERIAGRYSDADMEKLPSVIVFAKVMKMMGKVKEDSPEWKTTADKAFNHLEIILSRNDPGSLEVAPNALYTKAYIFSRQGKNIDAGKVFDELVRRFPNAPVAFSAALNAIISYNNVIQDKMDNNEAVPSSLRWMVVHSYRALFGKKEWAADDKAQPLRFGYGFQLFKLAALDDAGSDTPASVPASGASAPAIAASAPAASPSKLPLLLEAIGVLEGVAPNQGEYYEARFMGIQMRDQSLVLIDKAAQKAAAADLVKTAQSFLADAGKAAAAAKAANKDADYKDLRRWASETDVLLAVANHEYLDKKDQAVADLKAMATKWADTDAQKIGTKYLIQWALLDGQTADAVNLVKDFRTKYPQEATGLIRMVIDQLRGQIRKLRYDAKQATAFNNYRKAYFEFAKVLYEDFKKSTPNATMELIYAYEQGLADATLEMGYALRVDNKEDEAIKMFQAALEAFKKCKAHDDSKREESVKAIEAKFAAISAQVAKKDTAANAVDTAAGNLLSLLREVKLDPKTMTPAVLAQSSLARLREVQNKADKTEREVEQAKTALQRNIVNCCKAATEKLKKALPIDPVNLWGLARACRALKDYDEAMKNYRTLIAGLDRAAAPNDYWQAELEYAETALEWTRSMVAKNDKDEAEKAKIKKEQATNAGTLAVRVKQLRADDATMGGLEARFSAVEAECERIKGK